MDSQNLPTGCTIIEPAEDFDRCLLGTVNGQSCYDMDEVIEVLQQLQNFSEEDALEWFEYNIAGLPNICFLERYDLKC